jgi:hypothetical protein
MSETDPCAPDLGITLLEGELSLEDVVLMEKYEAEAVLLPLLDPAAEAAAEEAATAMATGEVEGAGASNPSLERPASRLRTVSGRYQSPRLQWQLELRVDVDGVRPMRRISGDFYQISGGTVSYFGSFLVEAVSLAVNRRQVVLVGEAQTTWRSSYNRIQVTIPRRPVFMPPSPAYVQWLTSGGQRGSAYTCEYESRYFRTVEIEQDAEQKVTPFVSYDTGSLSSGGPGRTLSIAMAYAEAGVDVRTAGLSNVVETEAESTWSNAELHDAMVSHFSLWKDVPQWKVWLLHAWRHDSPTTAGIMFDQEGKQRQGAAAFYHSLAGTSPEQQRLQLYVCVHELGHCFNLLHSFQKQYTDPPSPYRPRALSWMNYPQYYPDGQVAFWNAFPFAFDNLEIIHLRHTFRNNIIMGGNPFRIGAALEDPAAFVDVIEDNSGLRLELEAQPSFAFGEPVVVEVKLYLTDRRGKEIHDEIHPKFGFVQVAVQRPSGEVVVYKPLMEHCVTAGTISLTEDRPSVYASAYIGYDKRRGHLFDQPGLYRIRAVYYCLDGSMVLSETLSLRVRPPLTTADEKVAELLLGDEQGALLFLLGSDSDHLQHGNEALDQVLEQYGDHHLAVYARLVKGSNLAREFKTLTADDQVKVRQPQPEEAVTQLSAVVEASKAEMGVDNITLNETLQTMARAQMQAGDVKGARATITEMGAIFRKKDLKPHVQERIKEQQQALRAQL